MKLLGRQPLARRWACARSGPLRFWPRLRILPALLLLVLVAGPPDSKALTLFYPSLYYPNSPDPGGASSVVLQPGQTSSPLVLPVVSAGGSIALRVVDDQGTPLEGVLVEALSGRFSAVALSEGDGRALLTGVPNGEAIVRARPDDLRSRTGAYSVRYAPGVPSPEEAERFVVTDRRIVDAGDLTLPAAGRVKAKVLRPNHDVWPGLPIVLRSVDGAVRFERQSDDEGRVTFGGLEPGSYRLWADARGTDAVTEGWDGSRDTLDSTPLVVTRGSLVSGILIQTDRGGEIRGAVRDIRSNEGFPGIEVRFLPVSSPGTVYRFMTDQIGFYFAYGLPGGAYKIYVPAIRRWYPSAQNESGARRVTLSEGDELEGIDVLGELSSPCSLPPEVAGTIEGGVQADFSRMPSAQIIAWGAQDTFRVSVTQTSIYRIGCLPAGSYRVAMIPDGVYRTQYHRLTNDPAAARVVAVTAGDTTRGVNFFPELGVVIEGNVVAAPGGLGIAGLPVLAISGENGGVIRTVSGEDGSYRIDRLPDGTGLPAGSWIVGTDSVAISTIAPTPVLAVALQGQWTAQGIRLSFSMPAGAPVRRWWLDRQDADGSTQGAADDASHPEGIAALGYLDPVARGAHRYRLTVAIEWSGEEVMLRSDWIAVGPPASSPRAVAPLPWNGKGSLRLPVPVPAGEWIELFAADGSRVMRLRAAGDRADIPDGRIPEPGVYFLRWRGADGRAQTERLVITQ